MRAVTALAEGLAALGITHVVGIPDNTSAPLFDLLATSGLPTLLTVTREGEAFAIASGLWVGGKRPLVLIQNTGLLESGDAIRGTMLRMRAPIVTVVTCRGYGLMRARGIDPARQGGMARDLDTGDLLIDPELDAVALLAEPTLRAWGIPTRWIEPDEDLVDAIARGLLDAEERTLPVALILSTALDRGHAH